MLPEAAAAATADAGQPVDLAELAASIDGCSRCPLAARRTTVVFGEGDADAAILFIGEAPGAEEDRTGRPFVGRAGELLTRIYLDTRRGLELANQGGARAKVKEIALSELSAERVDAGDHLSEAWLARALVLANDRLFAAGSPDTLDPEDPFASLEGRQGALLHVYSARDGSLLQSYDLSSPPAFDGMSAAGEKLYLATRDHKLICFEPR